MEKKTVIITGGSSGMGKAMAKKQAELGWHVMVTGRNQEALEETKREIETFEGQVACFQMDVRSDSAASDMITEGIRAFGRVDALINNAAGNFICPAEKLTPNGWKAVIEIVLNGTFFCSQAAARYWIEKQQKGVIVNMAATYAWGAGAGRSFRCSQGRGIVTDKNPGRGVGEPIWNSHKRDCTRSDRTNRRCGEAI